MLTTDLLTRLSRSLGGRPSAAVVAGIVDHQHILLEGGISTRARLAEFLAQACIETDHFKTLREYWGPTATQKRYEGREDLGNVVAGDGKRFMGRGIFQLTGRYNYREYGRRLGVDLTKDPALAERADISVRTAVMYWNDRKLSQFADKGDTRAISRAINRGNAFASKPANHEAERIRVASLARQILADVVPAPPPAAPAAPAPASPPPARDARVEPAPDAPRPPSPPAASPPAAAPAPPNAGFWSRLWSGFFTAAKGP
jgi:putative chitinase